MDSTRISKWRGGSRFRIIRNDSICGCSVDQVHTDMRYRFDQAAMLAETVTRRASRACLAESGAVHAEFAVFNPSFSTRALVSGEVELAEPGAHYAVQTSDGRHLPVAIESCARGAGRRFGGCRAWSSNRSSADSASRRFSGAL